MLMLRTWSHAAVWMCTLPPMPSLYALARLARSECACSGARLSDAGLSWRGGGRAEGTRRLGARPIAG